MVGKRFRIVSPTAATEIIDGRLIAATLPVGATLEVLAGRGEGHRMIDVRYNGRILVLFAGDLNERAIEMTDGHSGASAVV